MTKIIIADVYDDKIVLKQGTVKRVLKRNQASQSFVESNVRLNNIHFKKGKMRRVS